MEDGDVIEVTEEQLGGGHFNGSYMVFGSV